MIFENKHVQQKLNFRENVTTVGHDSKRSNVENFTFGSKTQLFTCNLIEARMTLEFWSFLLTVEFLRFLNKNTKSTATSLSQR